METQLITLERGIPIPPRYPKRKAAGPCPSCARMPRSGLTYCDHHLAKQREWARARILKGLCVAGSCKNSPAKGRTQCREHLRSMVIYSQSLRHRRTSRRLCIQCGKRPAWWTLFCVICRTGNDHHYKFILPSGARKALQKHRHHERIDARRQQAEIAVEWTDNPRIAKIFSMRHGLEDGSDRTLEEIGAVFSVTRERIRQIEDKHLTWLASEGFDLPLLRPPFEAAERQPLKTRTYLVSDGQRKKAHCHVLVKEALEQGTLIKGLCGTCQAVDVVGHHNDYDKPLEVEWLCRKHHMDAHRGFWLDKFDSSSLLVSALRRLKPRQEDVLAATGISSTTLLKILRGDTSVKRQYVLAVERYANHKS